MQYPSIMIAKLFMGGIFSYIYIHCLHFNIGFLFLFYLLFVLGFEAQQRRLLLQMQFNLRLNTVNYLLSIMQ